VISKDGFSNEQFQKWTMKILDPYTQGNTEQVFPNRRPRYPTKNRQKRKDLKKDENTIELDAFYIWKSLPKPNIFVISKERENYKTSDGQRNIGISEESERYSIFKHESVVSLGNSKTHPPKTIKKSKNTQKDALEHSNKKGGVHEVRARQASVSKKGDTKSGNTSEIARSDNQTSDGEIITYLKDLSHQAIPELLKHSVLSDSIQGHVFNIWHFNPIKGNISTLQDLLSSAVI